MGVLIKNGFSLSRSPNKIDLLENKFAGSMRAAEIIKVLDQAKAIKGQTLTFTLPGQDEINIKKGTVIIIEGSLARSMLPLVIPTVGVYLQMDSDSQKVRIYQRGVEKKRSFIRVFVEDKIKRSNLLRGLIEARSGEYDYLVVPSLNNGPITMAVNKNRGQLATVFRSRPGDRAMAEDKELLDRIKRSDIIAAFGNSKFFRDNNVTDERSFVDVLRKRSKGVCNYEELEGMVSREPITGYALGMDDKDGRNNYYKMTHKIRFLGHEEASQHVGVNSGETDDFLQASISTNRPIVFFVPSDLMRWQDKYTFNELLALFNNHSTNLQNFYFVFGLYEGDLTMDSRVESKEPFGDWAMRVEELRFHMKYHPENKRLYVGTQEAQPSGKGTKHRVFSYGKIVIRVNTTKGEVSMGNHLLIDLAENKISPSLKDSGFIKDDPHEHYVTVVDKIIGESLDQMKMFDQKLVIGLVEKLLKNKIFIGDFKPENIMIGYSANDDQQKVQAWLTDWEHAFKEPDSKISELAEHYYSCMTANAWLGFDKKFIQEILDYLDIVRRGDDAQLSAKGGIDLTPAHMHMQTDTGSLRGAFGESYGGIKFHLDPAQLSQLLNAPGFVPVIISVEPMKDLKAFLMNQ